MTQQIKIDKAIPITRRRMQSSEVDYPFEQLQIGDSFQVIPEDYQRVAIAAHRIGKSLNVKFCLRMTRNGPRLWRIR